MRENRFQLQPGEEVILQTQFGREWYHVAFNILVGLLYIALAILGGRWWVRLLDESLGLREIEPWWVFPLTQTFYLTMIPILVTAWRAESYFKLFAVEALLTDRRIFLKATPHLWDRTEISLADITLLSEEGFSSDVRFARHSGVSAVYQVPQRTVFIQAFDEITGFRQAGEKIRW